MISNSNIRHFVRQQIIVERIEEANFSVFFFIVFIVLFAVKPVLNLGYKFLRIGGLSASFEL